MESGQAILTAYAIMAKNAPEPTGHKGTRKLVDQIDCRIISNNGHTCLPSLILQEDTPGSEDIGRYTDV